MSTLHKSSVDSTRPVGFNLWMAVLKEDVGPRLKATREALGLTQEELCERIGVGNVKRWSNYEMGDRMVDLSIAERFCEEFGLTFDWIFRADPARIDNDLMIAIKRELAKAAA